MSDWVTIQGLVPYDGRYELDLDGQPLTTREWGWIKRHAGYLPLTLTGEAFTDPELISVLAVIAARRAGAVDTGEVAAMVDRLADAPFGATVTLDTDPAGADAGPPPGSSGSRPSSSGAASTNGSATSADAPSPTGAPRSDTSPSDQRTSVS